MEAVTHFVNDTVEFYKWGLTIAGKIFTIFCFLITKVVEKCPLSYKLPGKMLWVMTSFR